jgi:hypothetical protein
MTPLVWGFFYGGLINPVLMERLGMQPRRKEIALLPGYDLEISPLMNLVVEPRATAYGLLMELSHDELASAYGKLKAVYYPQPVLAYDLEGRARPALCYLLPDQEPGPAEADYVTNLLEPAKANGFPDWYLDKIRSFLPTEVNA